MCVPLLATTVWHPSMEKSAFVGAVGSSVICQGANLAHLCIRY